MDCIVAATVSHFTHHAASSTPRDLAITVVVGVCKVIVDFYHYLESQHAFDSLHGATSPAASSARFSLERLCAQD
jgi:hypothetical protein